MEHKQSYKDLKTKIYHLENELLCLKNQLSNHPYTVLNEKKCVKNVVNNLRKFCEKNKYNNYNQILNKLEENITSAPRLIEYSLTIEGRHYNVCGTLKACFYKYKDTPVFFYNFDIDENFYIHPFTLSNYFESQWCDKLPEWIVNYLPENDDINFNKHFDSEIWRSGDKDVSKLLNCEVDELSFIQILMADIEESGDEDEETEEVLDVIKNNKLFSNIATNFIFTEDHITEEWEKNELIKSKFVLHRIKELYHCD